MNTSTVIPERGRKQTDGLRERSRQTGGMGKADLRAGKDAGQHAVGGSRFLLKLPRQELQRPALTPPGLFITAQTAGAAVLHSPVQELSPPIHDTERLRRRTLKFKLFSAFTPQKFAQI